MCTTEYIRGINQKKESSWDLIHLPEPYYHHKIKNHFRRKETL